MDFNRRIDRRNICSEKWDLQGGDYLPMWVADMDFPIPRAITEALENRLKRESFGFSYVDDGVYQAIMDYYRKQFGIVVEKEWIVWVPSVMPGANLACRMAGGHLMINTPMYPHIRRLCREARTEALEVPLKLRKGVYTMDFDAMEQAMTPEVRVFVLSNPHNPVGRVFLREELEELDRFCRRHDLLVISDEIHSDLVLEGSHIPYFSLGKEAGEHSVTLSSASKTYNIPAIPYAYAVIPNPALRQRYLDECYGLFSPVPILAAEAIKTAYSQCEDWRRELLAYLRANRDYMEERIAAIPQLDVNHNEATYLAWVDCRKLEVEDPYVFFRERAGVNMNDGKDFGAAGFVRLNFGCPRAQLKEALDRMEDAIQNL